MKYRLEYRSNKSEIVIHLQKRLCNKYQSFESPDDKASVWVEDEIISKEDPPRFITLLWGIEGIVCITIDQYRIRVEKGAAFDWKDLTVRILAILNEEFFPDSVPELLSKPKGSKKKKASVTHRRKCKV